MRGLTDRRIAHALTLIHERYADPWTLDSLARTVGTSRTALAVRFKALVGESPMAYLLRWRITRAAEQVGFRSDAVFAKAFKRVTGESPGRFRRAPGPSAAAV